MSNQKIHKLGQYIPIHYHYQMLSDLNRMSSFRQAISMSVCEGQRVVDLGSGTGALAFFAAKEGAVVTGIENNSQLFEYSKKLISENQMNEQVQIIHEDAMNWLPDMPVDTVICEMLHSALLREKQIQVINAFKEGHLKKFDRVPCFIPYATLLAAQPIYMDYDFQGFIAPIPLFQDPYSTESAKDNFVPQVFKTVVYEDEEDGMINAELIFTSDKPMFINALRFVTKNILSMNRLTRDSSEWFNQYLVLPMRDTLELVEGECLRVTFQYCSGDEIEVLQESLRVEKFV